MYVDHVIATRHPAVSPIGFLDPETDVLERTGETLEQVQAREPRAERMTHEALCILQREAAYLGDPVRDITEEAYISALECMPPNHWARGNEAESFQFFEHTVGQVTQAYVRIVDRFYTLQVIAGTPHADIITQVMQSRPKHSAAQEWAEAAPAKRSNLLRAARLTACPRMLELLATGPMLHQEWAQLPPAVQRALRWMPEPGDCAQPVKQ